MSNDLAYLQEGLQRILANDPALAQEIRDTHVRLADPLRPGASFESLGTAEGPFDPAEQIAGLETIVKAKGRPVLTIRSDDYVFATNDADSEVWRGRLANARPALRRAIPAVGRVELANNYTYSWVGTAWLVDEEIVVTNRHVAAVFAQRQQEDFVFKIDLGYPVPMAPSVDFLQEAESDAQRVFTVLKVLYIEPDGGPDLAFMKVARQGTSGDLARPLELADGPLAPGRIIAAIGYPARDSRVPDQTLVSRIFGDIYDKKRLAPGQISSVGEQVVTHDASTLGGNSGSALIDLDTGQVVGLHRSGLFLKDNYAVPAAMLRDRLRRLRDKGGVSRPATSTTPVPPADATVPQRPVATATAKISLGADAHEVVIPLEIRVKVGSPTTGAAPAAHVTIRPAVEGAFTSGGAAAAVVPRFALDSLSATAFNWQTALSLALASQLSYAAADEVRHTALSDWGLQTCEFIEAGNTQCFVATSPAAMLVAFRGTESTGDWLADLNALGTDARYGRVHRGFYYAFQDVRDQAVWALSQQAGRPVFITGHSLGGALATIAAAEWQGEFNVGGVYTYGQPRVGGSDFKAYIDQRYSGSFFRFANNNDIVPRVPPGYSHVGRLFHFDADGGLEALNEAVGAGVSSTEPPPLTEAQFDQLRAQLLAERARRGTERVEAPAEAPQLEGLWPSFSDHRLDGYIAKIAPYVTSA